MDGLVTKVANHEGLSPAGSHGFDLDRRVLPLAVVSVVYPQIEQQAVSSLLVGLGFPDICRSFHLLPGNSPGTYAIGLSCYFGVYRRVS
jgi:hypothetical protein